MASARRPLESGRGSAFLATFESLKKANGYQPPAFVTFGYAIQGDRENTLKTLEQWVTGQDGRSGNSFAFPLSTLFAKSRAIRQS